MGAPRKGGGLINIGGAPGGGPETENFRADFKITASKVIKVIRISYNNCLQLMYLPALYSQHRFLKLFDE